jgi:hypothetical protein
LEKKNCRSFIRGAKGMKLKKGEYVIVPYHGQNIKEVCSTLCCFGKDNKGMCNFYAWTEEGANRDCINYLEYYKLQEIGLLLNELNSEEVQ